VTLKDGDVGVNSFDHFKYSWICSDFLYHVWYIYHSYRGFSLCNTDTFFRSLKAGASGVLGRIGSIIAKIIIALAMLVLIVRWVPLLEGS